MNVICSKDCFNLGLSSTCRIYAGMLKHISYVNYCLTDLRYAPPVVCYTVKRSVKDRLVLSYGFMCQLYDRLRTHPRVLPLDVGRSLSEDSV